ncbi:unnamed protein product [Boreogadus saida]
MVTPQPQPLHPLSWRGTAQGHKGSSSGPVQDGSDLREPSPRKPLDYKDMTSEKLNHPGTPSGDPLRNPSPVWGATIGVSLV